MGEVLKTLLIVFGIGAVLGLIGLFLIYRRLRFLSIPVDADLRQTLLRVPLSLVLVLDLLDFGFDFLAAPFVWVLLGRFNLHGLRTLTTVEAAIPGTQFIPVMTLSWIGVRLLPRHEEQGRIIDDQSS